MPDYPEQILIEPLPGPFDTALRPPGSKSLTNRALLLAALAEGTSKLTGVLFSDDTRVMMRALEELDVQLEIDEPTRTIKIEGRQTFAPAELDSENRSPTIDVDLGNAGTAMRFLAASCAASPCLSCRLDGIERMRHRPIGDLVNTLRQCGADISYEGVEGYPPLLIEGVNLDGDQTKMKASMSSQYVSAILIASTLFNHGYTSRYTLKFDGPVVSWPYIEMTIRLMQVFGVKAYGGFRNRSIHVPTPSHYVGCDYHIEPDASNASYFLAAAAVVPGGSCVIEGLGSESLQGDTRFAKVLGQMGAVVSIDAERISVSHRGLRGIDVDLNAMPDAAMTLATAAVFAEGSTTIRNIGNWRVKETDRMAAMKTELEKVGATVGITGDDLTIHPPANGVIQNPARGIDTYDDHRMAMAFSILGLRPGGPGITINDPGCVAKTYPGYWHDLARLRESAVAAQTTAARANDGDEGGAA